MRNRIKHFRELRGLTQEQLADLAGMSKAYVGLLENGKRQLNANGLEKLAVALRCKPSDLIQEDTDLPEDLQDHIDVVKSLRQPARENIYQYAITVQRAERA